MKKKIMKLDGDRFYLYSYEKNGRKARQYINLITFTATILGIIAIPLFVITLKIFIEIIINGL